MTREERNAYMREWYKTPAGIAARKRVQEKRRANAPHAGLTKHQSYLLRGRKSRPKTLAFMCIYDEGEDELL